VTYRDASPERAQRITNAIVDTYVQQNLDGVLESTISAGDWLRSQLHNLKDDLEDSEMALHDYKQHKHILSVSLDDQSNMLREEMQQLNGALTSVRTQLQRAVAKRDELNKIDTANPSHLPALELLDNPTLQQLRNAYVESERRRQSLLSAGKGAQHPEVAAEQAKTETLRTAILDEVKNIQEATEREVNVLRREERGLAGLYANAEQRARDLNLLEIEYTRLMRAKDNNEKLFSLVLERTKESDLARMLRVNNIRAADRPILPKVPVSPHVPMNIAVGALLGLLLGLSTAIGREHLDRSIKSPEDIEKDLGLTFLGMLPELDENGSNGNGYRSRYGQRKAEREGKNAGHGDAPPLTNKPELAVYEHSTSAMAEAARAIRTNILFMSPDEPYRTLLVTSASPREGKTTVACCIAVAMAQAGQRVALLDCDMRRPRLHRVFSKLVNEGLTNALIDPSRADKMAQQTTVPNLWVVPTGPLPPNPAELLHSEAFEKLLNALRDSFDRVVVDSPPIAPVTDAAILSTKVDGTLLVVRALKTKKDPARRSVRALTDVGGRLVGVVLNAVSGRGNPDYYHYY
jgi:capsular exopolysaccharide synthesis family protein